MAPQFNWQLPFFFSWVVSFFTFWFKMEETFSFYKILFIIKSTKLVLNISELVSSAFSVFIFKLVHFFVCHSASSTLNILVCNFITSFCNVQMYAHIIYTVMYMHHCIYSYLHTCICFHTFAYMIICIFICMYI